MTEEYILVMEVQAKYQEPTDLSPPKMTEKPEDWPEDGEEFVP
jgi:hypothetical protein